MRVLNRPRNEWSRRLAAAVGMLALAVSGAAFAEGGGGGGHGGGGHAAGGGHGGGGGGGHASAAPRGAGGHAPAAHYSARAGYYGGHGGGYAPHGGYSAGHANYYGGHGGYHGGYGGHGYYGAWYGGRWYGWGGVFPLGLYFATLPLYYQTLYWGGIPYYYANDTFYRWNDDVAQYETVAPPADASNGGGPGGGGESYVYPRQGQSPEQLKADRYECYRWAADQTGFDPTRASGGPNGQGGSEQAGAYRRAESACLEGRGYTVR